MVRSTKRQSEEKENMFKIVHSPCHVTYHTSNKKALHAWHGECSNNIAGRSILVFVGKVPGPPNHGTITPWNHNTIQSLLHELCGCGESNACLKRITKANYTLHSTEVKSILYGFDPSAIFFLIWDRTLKKSGESNQRGKAGMIESNLQGSDPLRVMT